MSMTLSETSMFTSGTQRSVADLSNAESLAELRDETNTHDYPNPNPNPWDTSDPFFSAQTRDVLKMVFKCYIRQFFIFVGIPGNLISCLVFLKLGLWDRINLLLFSLAVADLITLVTQLLFKPSCYWMSEDVLRAANWDTVVSAKILHVNRWASIVSGTLMVIMSLDRCLSVVMPLKAGRLLNYRAMATAILLAYLIHLTCDIPSFLAFSVRWRVDPSTNDSVAYMEKSGVFTTESTIPSQFLNLLNITTKIVSVVVVVVCCVITVVSLRHASRQRLQMTGKVKEEGGRGGDDRITRMLLFLCVVYVVLILPEVCSAITFAFVPDYFLYRKYHNTFVIVYEVLIYTASSMNSTANFFAYLVLSSKFQKALKNLCPCFERESNRRVRKTQDVEFTTGTSLPA